LLEISEANLKRRKEMERVLALQTLSAAAESDPVPVEGCSGASNGCSSSSGTGKSGCSIGCGESEEMEW